MKSSPDSDRPAGQSSSNTRKSRSRSRSRSPRRVKVRSRRVVIANIPYHVTWVKLKQLFREQLGFTGYLRLMKDNGRLNGMGLMEFKSMEGAEKAIEKMHRFEIGDRRIVVREETLRDQERMAHMEFDGPSNQSMDNGGGGPNMPPSSVPPMPHQSRANSVNPVPPVANMTPKMLEGMGIRGPITDSLYVSNLNYNVDWKKVKDTFKAAGRVIHATVKQDDEGHSKGAAVVRFEQPFEALLAMAMFNGQDLNGRPLRIKIDREGHHNPPDVPVFPPTPQGSAAAASFMAYLNNSRINSGGRASSQGPSSAPAPQPPIFGGDTGFTQQSSPNQQQSVAAANPALAAAMAALLGRNVPAQDILSSLLGAASGGASNAMTGGSGYSAGTPAMNPLNQLMGMQGGGMGQGGSSYNNSSIGGGMGGDRPRDNGNIIQQFLLAAAAGGMPQDQIAQAVASLGLNRDGGPLGPQPPFCGGMMNSPVGGGDRYGDRRPQGRPDFDSRSRYRDDIDEPPNYRPMGNDNRGGRGPMGGRNDDRMYMRR